MASSPTAPGVKIDKQTSLRLTSTKHYVEEDVSSLVSGMSNSSPEGEKKKGLLRKLQWRSPPANQGKRLPPSTSPLSRKLGAPKPSGKGRGRAGRNNRSKLSANRGNRNVCVSSSDNNLVSSSDATVASQKTSYTKTSQGTTVSTKTLKHSNKGMGQMGGNSHNNCGASVTSSVNSRIPPLARLRKRVPLIIEEEQDFDEEESVGMYSQQSMTQDDGGQVVMFGSKITITKNYDESSGTPAQEADKSNILGEQSIRQAESDVYCNQNTCTPTKYCDGKANNTDSPTSVVLAQEDPFCGALASLEKDESDAPEFSDPPMSSSTPKRSAFSKRGVMLSTTKSGKTMETCIQGVNSLDSSSQIEKNNATDYRNAMNRMRKLMTGAAEKDELDQAKAVEGDYVDDVDNSMETSVFSDLVSAQNNPSQECAFTGNQEDDESTTQNTRQPGPIDVDTLTRHITPTERRHLRAMHKLGFYHLRRNEINQALNIFMEILRGQRERHGKRSLEVAMAMHNLGVVCVKGGRFEEGTQLCDGAARIRVEKLGKDHLDVAVSLAQQGVALMEIQEYAIALASFREALRIRRKSLGSKHPLVIRLLNNIGCALFEMNNLDDARVAFEEALDLQRGLMRENSLGEKCPSTSESLKGNKDTNEIGQDLELEEEIDPREAHNMLLSIALTLCNLGSIHLRWGMYDQSLAFYEEALLIQESVLGEDHNVVANTNESIEFVVRSKEENHHALLENDIDTKKIPSILNMNRLANILLPRYEEGKRIYDKVTNEIGALIDSVAAPNSDTRDGVSSQLICGQPLMCADE